MKVGGSWPEIKDESDPIAKDVNENIKVEDAWGLSYPEAKDDTSKTKDFDCCEGFERAERSIRGVWSYIEKSESELPKRVLRSQWQVVSSVESS